MINKLIYLLLTLICYFLMVIFPKNRIMVIFFAALPFLFIFLRSRVTSNLNVIMGSIFFLQGSLGYLFFDSNGSTSGTSLSYLLPSLYAFDTFMIFVLSSYICIFFGIESNAPKQYLVSINNFLSRPYFELILLLPAFGVVMTGGLSELFFRNTHLYGNKNEIFTHIFSLLSLIAPAVITLVGRLGRSSVRYRCFLYLLLYNLLFFSLGSRKLAIGLFLLVFLIPTTSVLSRIFQFIFATLLSLIGIAVSLFLRGLFEQGLGPYLEELPNFDLGTIFSTSTIANILGGFPVSGISAFIIPQYPKWHFLVEINPLWGDLAGWYDIAQMHSINAYTPSSGLGDLWNYGFFINILFWFVLNFLMKLRAQRFRKLTYFSEILHVAYGLSVIYFSIAITQYSLRASLRAILYVVFIDFLCTIYIKFFPKNSNWNISIKNENR